MVLLSYDSYCLLPFSCNLNIISLISPHLISLLFKNKPKEVNSPNYTDFSKNQKRLCLVLKIVQGESILQTVFQLLKITYLGQFEKSQHVYLSEKEGETISAIRNTVFHDTENLDLVPIYEAKSGEGSTMDQDLDICNRIHEIATYNMRRVYVTMSQSRSTM